LGGGRGTSFGATHSGEIFLRPDVLSSAASLVLSLSLSSPAGPHQLNRKDPDSETLLLL
jgi:hypothetical protein